MGFQVHVETFKEYSYSGPFDFKELIDYLKAWYERNGYDINKKIVNGDLKLTLEFADVKRDIEEKWEGPVSKRFARAVYDKFIMEDKESEINKQLKKEVESLFKEIKQYFG